MFRIGLDLRATEPGFKAHFGRGTGRYATELVSRLVDNKSLPNLSISGLGSKDIGMTGWQYAALNVVPAGKVTLETQFFLPQRIAKAPIDCIHFFAHGDAPARLAVPSIVTVLDLIPLRFPELYKAKKSTWRFRLARYLELAAIRQAKGIIAISEATKRDLIEILGVKEETIHVTHLGVGEQFLNAGQLVRANGSGSSGAGSTSVGLSLRAKFDLPEEQAVFLYVGGIDPRKNVRFMLQAFSQFLRGSESKPLLVVAGGIEKDRDFPDFRRDIQRLGLEEHVRLLGFVPDADLPQLYQTADVFLFPSLYEGFGLPVAEAMACGLPVIAGANSSIPEVAGGAATLLPDADLKAWVDAMGELIWDKAKSEALVEAGLKRAAELTWDSTVSQTVRAYEQIGRSISPSSFTGAVVQEQQRVLS